MVKTYRIYILITILLSFLQSNTNQISNWECYSEHNKSNQEPTNHSSNARNLDKAVIRAKIWKIHTSEGIFEMTDNAIEDGFSRLVDVYKDSNILIHLVDIENIYNDSLYYFSYYGRPFELMQSHTVDTLINFYYLPSIDYTGGTLTGYGQAFNTPGNELFVAGNECQNVNSELICYDLANTFIPIHELGHCLGLFHPHTVTYGIENVIRPDEYPHNPCEVNCDSTGDFLCDTEASNSLKNDVVSNGQDCSYDLIEIDSCGYTYQPQIDNFMSYTHFDCATSFTQEQVNKMFIEIENDHTLSQTIIDMGDFNDDSIVNIVDVIVLVNNVLNEENLSELHFWIGDINNDLAINIMDIVLIANMILEQD